jgi:hypothetical protein
MEGIMRCIAICATVLAAALITSVGGAVAFDDSKYPDLKGQWRRAGNAGLLAGGFGGIRWDNSNPPASDLSLGQKPPLTPEYQSIYDENLDDMAKGGQGIDPTATCVSPGMPRVMIGDGVRGDAGCHLHPDGAGPRPPPPHLHRRPHVPCEHGGQSAVPGLLDRPVDR